MSTQGKVVVTGWRFASKALEGVMTRAEFVAEVR